MRRFLFEYPYEGAIYCIEIPANSEQEAIDRKNAIIWGKFKGEIFATIPVSPVGWLRKLLRF